MHLSTCEQLLAYLGKIGTLKSASQVWDGEVGGRAHLAFQTHLLHNLGKKELGSHTPLLLNA